jgi:hypothetical protein
MKVVILYRPSGEHARQMDTFIHDFKDRHESGHLEVYDQDSRDGQALASLYDIFELPAILALGDDGSLLKFWTVSSLPLMDELAYYTYA